MEKYRHNLFQRGSGAAQGGPWCKAPGSSRVIQQKAWRFITYAYTQACASRLGYDSWGHFINLYKLKTGIVSKILMMLYIAGYKPRFVVCRALSSLSYHLHDFSMLNLIHKI
jgi:hypothetical protein